MTNKIKSFFQKGVNDLSALPFSIKIASIIFIGVFCHLFLMNNYNANHDEAFTLLSFQYSWKEMIAHIAREDGMPPLHHIFLRLWLFGNDFHQVFLPRVSNIFVLVCMTLLGVFPIRRITNNNVALIFAIFVFFFPTSFLLATNMRGYILAAFFTLGTFIYSITLAHTPQKKDWILFIIFTIAGLYTHYYCALSSFLIWFCLFLDFIYQKKWRNIILLFLSGITVSICFLPWLFQFFGQYHSMKEIWYPSLTSAVESIHGILGDFKRIKSFCIPLIIFLTSFAWILIIQYIIETKKIKNLSRLIVKRALIVYLGVWGLAFLISILIRPMLSLRYMLPQIGLLYLAGTISLLYFKNSIKFFIIALTIISSISFFEYKDMADDFGYIHLKQYIQKNISQKDSLILYTSSNPNIFLKFYTPEYKMIYAADKNEIVLMQKDIQREYNILDDFENIHNFYSLSTDNFCHNGHSFKSNYWYGVSFCIQKITPKQTLNDLLSSALLKKNSILQEKIIKLINKEKNNIFYSQ